MGEYICAYWSLRGPSLPDRIVPQESILESWSWMNEYYSLNHSNLTQFRLNSTFQFCYLFKAINLILNNVNIECWSEEVDWWFLELHKEKEAIQSRRYWQKNSKMWRLIWRDAWVCLEAWLEWQPLLSDD